MKKTISFVMATVFLLVAATPALASAPAVVCPIGDPVFSVTGAPETVTMSSADLANVVTQAVMDKRGPSENLNSLGLNTQFAIADAGVYLTFDQVDADKNESAWLVTPDTQFGLPFAGPAQVNLAEGGFLWVTGAASTLSVGDYVVTTEAQACHSWFNVLSGKAWDHAIDTDNNVPVMVSGYNPGFVQVDRFPPGSFLSQKHLLDNAASAHVEKNCGSDGCTAVSVVILDLETGAWVVITQDSPTAPWRMVATNVTITD